MACSGPRLDAQGQIDTAIVLLGDLAAAGPLTIQASGTLNKTAEGQGWDPDVPSAGPFSETIAVDPAGDAVLWDYREHRYDGTTEAFGEAYPSDVRQVLLIRDAAVAVPFDAASFAPDRRRLRRRIPHLLLDELRQTPGALRLLGSDDRRARIQGELLDGKLVTVDVDRISGLVLEVEYALTFPGRGPVRIVWWYDDYREVAAGVQIPFAYGSRVDDVPYTTMAVERTQFGDAAMFSVPDDLRTLAARPKAPVAAAALHHHRDHLGGVRAYVAAGATVLGAPATLDVARRLTELSASAVPDRLAETGAAWNAEVVDAPRRISDGAQTIEILPIGDNPHARGMLVIELPKPNLLYVSDLLTPGALERYPAANHAALDRFVASWLQASARTPTAVWTMHGTDAVTRAHLARAGVGA